MSSQIIRRYTSLASALDILETKTLTLLPPSSWDDEVDRSLMAAFQRRKKLKSVLALCFAAKGETYHHWRVFTGGASGTCIAFEKDRLERAVASHGVTLKPISYKTIASDRAKPVTTDDLPFTKRAAFKDEGEVRMVFTSHYEQIKAKRVPFPPGAIEEVILSPWTPDPLVQTIRAIIERMSGLPQIEVRKSSLFNSAYWRRVADA